MFGPDDIDAVRGAVRSAEASVSMDGETGHVTVLELEGSALDCARTCFEVGAEGPRR